MKCPLCGGKRHRHLGVGQFYECRKCGAHHGEGYLGDSYGIVRPYFSDDPESDSRAKYYDFTVFGSKGQSRRHGWFDPKNRKITQVG